MSRMIRVHAIWLPLVLSATLLAGCGGITTRQTGDAQAPEPTYQAVTGQVVVATPTPLSQDAYSTVRADEELLINLYERVSPSVVHIQVTTAFGEAGSGSGFFYDSDGNIVTNNHVVEDSEQVRVILADGTQVPAEVVGTDPDADLAVIRVEAPAELVVPATMGDSTQVRVGQWAVAIGNPFGLERTLTRGIVSALGRVFPQETGYSVANLIQTDAPINPGNSGGPLLDLRGRVIGVNTMIVSESGSSAGLGFAIPAHMVQKVVPALIEEGVYRHPWLGIRGYTITPDLATAFDLPTNRGALIAEVEPGSPSDRAGLRGGSRAVNVPGYAEPIRRGGDIVVGIDGNPVTGMDSVISYLDFTTVGQVVTLEVLRGGDRVQFEVTLGARPTR